MQSVHANRLGLLAAQALNSDEESTIGQVIATFPNSFYVKTRDDQLLFITKRSLRSPITVNVAYSGNFTDIVKPLEPLYLHDRRLCNSNLSIEFTNTPPEEEKVLADNSPYYLKLAEASMLLSTILNVIENAGSVLDQDHPVLHDQSLILSSMEYCLSETRGFRPSLRWQRRRSSDWAQALHHQATTFCWDS